MRFIVCINCGDHWAWGRAYLPRRCVNCRANHTCLEPVDTWDEVEELVQLAPRLRPRFPALFTNLREAACTSSSP